MNFYELLSDTCYERIFDQGITSPELIFSLSCGRDFIVFPFLNKESKIHKVHVGLAACFGDILSIILIYYFFLKLKSINQEYLEIMDFNLIKMSKFTLQINDLKLNKATQDIRMLKMQIWLHFD